MEIVAICGSPRKGNTEFILKTILDSAKQNGAETELILLREKNIKFCDGCYTCEKTHACHIKDAVEPIADTLKDADIVIFGSPCYWDNVSGVLKNLFDRMTPYYYTKLLKGKSAVLVAVAESSADAAVDAMKPFCKFNDMKIVKEYKTLAKNPKDLEDKEEVIKELQEIGKGLAK